MSFTRYNLNRRDALKLAAGSAAASILAMPAIGRAATTQLSVANGGGALGDAFKVAVFDTFEKKTGIKIISAPYLEGAKLKAMVDANPHTLEQREAGSGLSYGKIEYRGPVVCLHNMTLRIAHGFVCGPRHRRFTERSTALRPKESLPALVSSSKGARASRRFRRV